MPFKRVVILILVLLPSLARSEDIAALFNLEGVKVVSVSKKQENSFDAASAIYVITQDDIERSGATSIPEALRLAPGLEVAKTDSNKGAISSRGFNRVFANKILVLIDGRSVYTPLFSGTAWDVQDTILEDPGSLIKSSTDQTKILDPSNNSTWSKIFGDFDKLANKGITIWPLTLKYCSNFCPETPFLNFNSRSSISERILLVSFSENISIPWQKPFFLYLSTKDLSIEFIIVYEFIIFYNNDNEFIITIQSKKKNQ